MENLADFNDLLIPAD